MGGDMVGLIGDVFEAEPAGVGAEGDKEGGGGIGIDGPTGSTYKVIDDFAGGGGVGVDEFDSAESVVGEVVVDDQDAGGMIFEVFAQAGQLAVGAGIDDND